MARSVVVGWKWQRTINNRSLAQTKRKSKLTIVTPTHPRSGTSKRAALAQSEEKVLGSDPLQTYRKVTCSNPIGVTSSFYLNIMILTNGFRRIQFLENSTQED
ncbi:unnamed protein product [Clavelina lepadiformis]|uniref:Uncharacterized protein n=1 Tax=Clavelina lepadiformis TaxID=159417 RepID=A0ABP0FLQ7_CLALP